MALRLPLVIGDRVKVRGTESNSYRDMPMLVQAGSLPSRLQLVEEANISHKICSVDPATGKYPGGLPEWDVVETLDYAPLLTLPIPDGVRVKLRNGKVCVTTDYPGHSEWVKLHSEGTTDEYWSLHRTSGRNASSDPNSSYENEHDIVEILPNNKLTLPLTVGQRVVCRDGKTHTVTGIERIGGDPAARFDNNHLVWAHNGCGNKDPIKNPNSSDAVVDAPTEIIAGEIDWKKPLVGDWNGKLVPVDRVEHRKSLPGGGFAVYFDESYNVESPEGSRRGFVYLTTGKHKHYPDEMPVLRNVGAPGCNTTYTDVDASAPVIRKRVRKAKPTLDQNFKELVTLVAEMKAEAAKSGSTFTRQTNLPLNIDRVQWLLKQIVGQIAKDQKLDETIAGIYEQARADAQKVVDDEVRKMQRERSTNDEIIAAQKAEIAVAWDANRKYHEKQMLKLESEFEARVQREVENRIDAMYGRTNVIKRVKRKIKVGTDG